MWGVSFLFFCRWIIALKAASSKLRFGGGGEEEQDIPDLVPCLLDIAPGRKGDAEHGKQAGSQLK